MQPYANFIAGDWVPPGTGSDYATHSPAHPEQELGQFPQSGPAHVDAAAFPGWAGTLGPQRGAPLYRSAQLLEDSKSDLAEVVMLEQGKALSESVGKVSRAVVVARYMAGQARCPLGQTFPSERTSVSCHTVLEPLGVVATINPWNVPVITPVRKIAPAIAYGNTVVFKPASLTPRSAVFVMSALAREEIFGPILPVIRVRDADEAIAVANDTRYGLAAAFTSRTELTHKFAAGIDAGIIHLSHGTASQACVPFGGRRESGQGAFSIGPTARDVFTDVKAVYAKW
ncbi:MAG TPA: aldehyde dehydrogenase family protein [bacterium]|nr:aldehyde dehydrogenase family protein [bacterium]